MKKPIFLALILGATLGVTSCNTDDNTPSKTQVRHLSYAMSGTSMYATKAVNTEDVLNAIEATLPESLDVVLTSQSTNRSIVGKTGEAIVLPSDTYRALATWGASRTSGIVSQTGNAYLTLAPMIDVDHMIDIVDDQVDYTLHAKYKSFALVYDNEDIERATIETMSGTEEVQTLMSGDSRIFFAQGDFGGNYLVLTLYPKDTEHYKATKYTISTTRRNGLVYAEYGKFYHLICTANGQQPKCLGYDLPTFTQGSIEVQ